MIMIRGLERTVTVGLVSGACCIVLVLFMPSMAVARNEPQPAFYPYRAPGGPAAVGKQVIALTVDDGSGPHTPQALSVLDQYHVPATLFEISENIVDYPPVHPDARRR
jgi:peptidoglycan/xylan/chitin deacetylase (PgdA/CDA1 family)